MFKLFKYLKAKDYAFLLLAVVVIVLQVWLELRMPEYMQKVIIALNNKYIDSSTRMNTILTNGGYMLLCAFGTLAGAVITNLFVSIVAGNFSYTLRSVVYNKIQGFSHDEYSKFSTPSLITRTTNDVTQIQRFIAMGTQAIVKAPITAVWAIIKIAGKGWQWSTATIVAVGVTVFLAFIITVFAVPKFRKIQGLTDNVNRVTRENLVGVRVIHASNAEDYQEAKFEKCNKELTDNNLFVHKIMAIMTPGLTLINQGLTLAIYWIGSYIVKDGLHYAYMLTFMQYAIMVIFSFMMLIMIFIMLPRALVSSKRINEVLNTQSSIVNGTFTEDQLEGVESVNKTAKDYYIVFDHVSFKYQDANKYVLKNINIKVKKGQTVAFIGSTGSGKSTLINLIPRLFDATDGNVYINGVNIKDYDIGYLNRLIGYVPQRGVLFSGTVKSNVNFGDNNADDETIKKALTVAQASNFVSKMENGIDSHIAQGGNNVSGGQKQRLSIARAIARNPEIFIFDDSFSALDFKTDKKLRAALKKHTEDATKFIVATRIGTIKDADQIIVLENGTMVGHGTHEELLETCDVYKEIALSQLSQEELQ